MEKVQGNDIIKNNRFKTLCTGTLFFNPYYIYRNYELSANGEESDNKFYYTHDILDNTGTIIEDQYITDMSIVAFGGQVAGFANWKTADAITWLTLALPPDAYDYYTSTDITTMLKPRDDVFAFRSNFSTTNATTSGYAFGFKDSLYDIYQEHIDRVLADGGIAPDTDYLKDFIDSIEFMTDCSTSYYGRTTNKDSNNEITDVMITEYAVIKNESSYGHHGTVYNSKATHTAKLRLPYKTPVWKIQQLMQSEHTVFMVDDRMIDGYNWRVPNGNNVQKPLGGGSISPMIRSVSIVSGTLTEKLRRGYYEVDVILHG